MFIACWCCRSTSRKRNHLHRRIYNVKRTNYLRLIGTNSKLFKWCFIVTGGCIGRFSRLPAVINGTKNNKAETALSPFSSSVKEYGLLLPVKEDNGKRNITGLTTWFDAEVKIADIGGYRVGLRSSIFPVIFVDECFLYW